MAIAILAIATLIMAAWLVLLARATDDDREQALQARVFDTENAISRLDAKRRANHAKMRAHSEAVYKHAFHMLDEMNRRKKVKLTRELERLANGRHNKTDTFIIPGYVLQREIEAIGKSGFRKDVLMKCSELYGKKHAGCKAGSIMAKMLSYPVIGVAAMLMLGASVLAAAEESTAGIGIIAIGSALVLVLAYGIYDELNDSVKKREKVISRQFPNVISKLALLVTSGMIMDRAWKETAYSHEAELYMEMRKTSEELDNLVSPEAAYGAFINRCNTKETAKLASAIMQNRSKGNAEIGRLLKDMAHEIWQERRHTAKRDAEKANSKLMIPTMLLFMAILIMLMVPIAMNFSGI